MKTRGLVIGYGNPLRGDDGFGWTVARKLADESANDGATRVIAAHQLTPELAEPVSEADLVIFVDASRDGEPGAWSAKEIAPSPTESALGHQFDAAGLLACAREIYAACPRAILVSVGADSFDCRETLSSRVAAVVPDVLRYIHNQLSAQAVPSHA
jgi:hydrogenase maturation protease